MSDLLTLEEYAGIAQSIDLPRAAFIDGRFQAGKGAKLTTVNPADGSTLCEISACNAADVDFAVEKAREAFERGVWAKGLCRSRYTGVYSHHYLACGGNRQTLRSVGS